MKSRDFEIRPDFESESGPEQLAALRRDFERHAENLDAVTAARLGAARHRALATKQRPVRELLPAGLFAAVLVAGLAVLLWALPMQQQTPAAPAAGDLDILLAGEELALYQEDLDFYLWLGATNESG